MWWECADCGCRSRVEQRPERCPVCGADKMFTENQDDDNVLFDPELHGFAMHWLKWGLESRRPPTGARLAH